MAIKSRKKPTDPNDTAYILGYQKYRKHYTAVVIAQNPLKAKRRLLRKLTGRDAEGLKPETVEVEGELREKVYQAQDDGVAEL